MTPQTSHENAHSAGAKPAAKRGGKAGIRDIMDDAPLFAGLDGFVLKRDVSKQEESSQAEKVEVEEKLKERDKKRAVTGEIKEASAESPSRPAPGGQKAPSSEAGAILLSVAEMCALLKISRATLVRMDKSGQLPGRIKLGGSVRFHRETVETWLKGLITPRPAP
ncbi:MAG: helix-turn-helix domain-containing protein [Deltaproteobacteria bacterium]|nr:helix-turn-helix domain-containing protein [Deltaproteobacteria bacterium]